MENREAEAFLDIVRKYDPDVILTVETDRWWEEALRTLEEKYPHTIKNPLDNTYGMLVHSRLKIIDPQIRFILMDSIPSMHMQVELPSGDRVFMHCVHPDPPNPEFPTETTERDTEVLIVRRAGDVQLLQRQESAHALAARSRLSLRPFQARTHGERTRPGIRSFPPFSST